MDVSIGILGCQSKHAEFFGMLFNVNRSFPGFSVQFIHGDDDPARLAYVLDTAQIPKVCTSPEELIHKSDAVLITYRMSERHFDPALACIQQGKPVFIDKPFTFTLEQALSIAEASQKYNVPVTGGSTLCFDPQIPNIKRIAAGSSLGIIAYRVDLNSPFDGYRFYGSHLTDLCAALFGTNALSTQAYRFDKSVNARVNFANQTVILHSYPDFESPEVNISDFSKLTHFMLDDSGCYFNGMRAFVEMIKSGQPDQGKLNEMVFSVKLLDSIMMSLKEEKEVIL